MKKIKNLLNFATGLSVVFLSAIPSSALDTIETYRVGPVTSLENYCKILPGSGLSVDFAAGGGIQDSLSWALSVCLSPDLWSADLNDIRAGLIWTVYEKNNFSMDILPFFLVIHARNAEEKIHSIIGGYTPGFDIEMNYDLSDYVSPYLRAGLNANHTGRHRNQELCALYTVGALFPIGRGIELLSQLSITYSDEAGWKNSDRLLSAGINIMATDNFELITEGGFEFISGDFTALAGFIFSLQSGND